jgi:uncharacterized protein
MTAGQQMEIVAAVREEAVRHFRGARGSHDWDHTERVRRLAERIARKEGADLFVVRLAAVLHDIGRAEEDRTNGRVCHSRRGAALAGPILKKHGLDRRTIERVAAAIRTHRFRGRLRPRTLEARVLFDADKLDSIGAIGIGRAFLFAGEVGARLHNSDVDIAATRPYTREDTAYREFVVKLGRVKDRLFTAEGKRIAAERHRFMVGFFTRLGKEEAGIL